MHIGQLSSVSTQRFAGRPAAAASAEGQDAYAGSAYPPDRNCWDPRTWKTSPPPAQEFQSRYGPTVLGLPGVESAFTKPDPIPPMPGFPPSDTYSFSITTGSEADSRYLSQLLNSEIEGVPVTFWPSPEDPGPNPPQQEVFRRYSPALMGMSSVTGAYLRPDPIPPMPGFPPSDRSSLVIAARSDEEASMLRNLLRSEVQGLPVQIYTAS
ncbi:MAG: hypothetical protein HY319_28580 [Armatimonadetes bacterium]|nr:hypothetical protein [Armatimonadota bacterium]